MSEEQLKASQEEITADTQEEVSDEDLGGAAGGCHIGEPHYPDHKNPDLRFIRRTTMLAEPGCKKNPDI